MTSTDEQSLPLPGKRYEFDKMPGHWLLAHLGKRVLRPGGMELTSHMMDALGIGSEDDVVEFAPGLGTTARLTLVREPASYIGVERDEDAANHVRRYLSGDSQQCIVGQAGETGLSTESATVIYGEAMLTMEIDRRKSEIVREANRLLRPGGRYGIHELCLLPDDLDDDNKQEIRKDLAKTIRVNARPLTPPEWRELLTASGFDVEAEARAPMHLLAPARFVQDEGIGGSLRFASNLMRNRQARKRVLKMRRMFRKHQEHLGAIMLTGIKRSARPDG